MKENEEGFQEPTIDSDKCIDCGLCRKICPVINTTNKDSLNECYVGYCKNNEMLNNSSSGGIFPLVANYILNENGIVIGAAFDENNKLMHIAIENKNELDKLKGSKYVQSDLEDIFKLITKNIHNRKILFVGVPCQVAGLKAYLRKDYDNLICIDLICHGVPSPKLFRKYINELEEKNNSKVVNYNFRDKSTGWDSYSNTVKLENNTISELASKNNYMKLFLSDIALRESCYNCNFKLGNKYSDLTLGDFWGLQKYYPEMYNKNGVSAIIINTAKGKELFNDIKQELNYKKCRLDEIVGGNPSLKKSSKLSSKRKVFFENIDKNTINGLTKKYIKKEIFFKRYLHKVLNLKNKH